MTIEEKISLMIPAYLRGELTDAERQDIEKHAKANPAIAADIEFQKNLKSALSRDEGEFEPGELGWARLSKAMETTPDLDVEEKPRNYWRYAAMILAVSTVAQGGLLGLLASDKNQDTPDAKYVTVSEAPKTAFSSKFGFKQDAMTADLTQALQSVDGTIINGPSSLGLYEVGFKSERACLEAVEKFGNEPSIVETVSACE